MSDAVRSIDRATGTILVKPSRFLDGIPDQLIEGYVVEREAD